MKKAGEKGETEKRNQPKDKNICRHKSTGGFPLLLNKR
jgi:hypothetical protein